MNKNFKKKLLGFFLLVIFLFGFSSLLLAEDVLQNKEIVAVKEFNPRKGFFISWGPFFGGELRVLEQFTPGTFVRIGAGITEKTLLFSESLFTYAQHQGLGYYTFFEQAKVKHFVFKELYVNFGVGFAVGNVAPIDAPNISVTRIGVSSSAQLGYEFRLTKKFAVSPEIGLYYHHLGESQDFISPQLDLNLSWYF